MKRLVLAIVGAQYLAAVLIGAASGFDYAPDFRTYFAVALAMSAIGTGCAALVRIGLAGIKDPSISPKAIALQSVSVDLPFVYFMVAAQLCVLSWLKAAMPYSVGFRFDAMLADLDAALFGADPWTLLTWIPGGALDAVYITWTSAMMLGMLVLPMLPASPLRNRSIVCYFLVCASASLGQYLMPSAGPIFFERIGLGDRFAELPVQPWVQVTSDYLWSNYLSKGERVGVGISAFPSLHVAGAAWLAIVATAYWPRLGVLAWAYFLLIFIGSVHLGWHYAVDGVVGAVFAVGCWLLLGRRVERAEQAAHHPLLAQQSIDPS